MYSSTKKWSNILTQSLKLHNTIDMIIQQQAQREHFVCNFSVLAMAYTLVVVKDSRKLREARLKLWVEINFEGIFLYQCFHKISKVEPLWFPESKLPCNKKTFFKKFHHIYFFFSFSKRAQKGSGAKFANR